MKRYILILLLLFSLDLAGQEDEVNVASDTIQPGYIPSGYHSPGKAALYSLIPGGGQIYNGRYWKVPIIYGGLILAGGWIVTNQNLYLDYKDEAINRFNNDTTINFPELTDTEVLNNKDFYERKRNLNIFLFVGIYVLNIVDATVDAHFFEYDISPDLSLRAEPFIRPPDNYSTVLPTAGITISLKL